MPHKKFLADFRASVSNERLGMYRQRGVAGGDENLVVHYAWNIALSEGLYPILQCMEIALRNSIHDTATKAFGTPYWFDAPGLLDPTGTTKIAEARKKLAGEGKAVTAAGIIAEQSFGFWTSLFAGRLDRLFWRKIVKGTFPGLPRHLGKRSIVSARLNEIRKIRNRVFHHEPIWHIRDLRNKHAQIFEFIEWISPPMAEFVMAIDRFPLLYSAGMTAFQRDLEQRFSRVTIPSTENSP